jgi:hypothetical protein
MFAPLLDNRSSERWHSALHRSPLRNRYSSLISSRHERPEASILSEASAALRKLPQCGGPRHFSEISPRPRARPAIRSLALPVFSQAKSTSPPQLFKNSYSLPLFFTSTAESSVKFQAINKLAWNFSQLLAPASCTGYVLNVCTAVGQSLVRALALSTASFSVAEPLQLAH